MRQTNRHHLFDQYSTHIDVEKKAHWIAQAQFITLDCQWSTECI